MRVVVSGANGFLGSWVSRVLIEKHQVIGFTRPNADVSNLYGVDKVQIVQIDESQFNRSISDISPDVVVLCDWWGVGNSFRNDRRQLINVERIRNRVQCLKNVETVIGVGSQAELGPRINAITEIEDDAPTTLYGRAKVEARNLLESNLGSDVRFIWSRIFSTYGPLDSDHWMIPSTISNLLNGLRIPLTKGEQEWSFLHSYDLGRAFEQLIEFKDISRIVNIGNPNTIRISEVALFIGNYLKLSSLLDFGAVPYREDQVMKLAPITKKLSDTGWSPEVSIENGITHLIEWMSGNSAAKLQLEKGEYVNLKLPNYLSKK
jgi:nucleoside-diphosphate-sugar epimerase